MKIGNWVLVLLLGGMCGGTAVAQIDMAALAQFKYNQQHALAASLSKGQTAAGRCGKQGRPKECPTRSTTTEKPAVIRAHNPTFKSIPGQSHRKNMR